MMETVIEQLETRLTRLIEEVESLRVTRTQLETENDGLKITLADYEQVRRERDEAVEALAKIEASSAATESEAIRQITEERDLLQLELDDAREALAGNAQEIDQLKAQSAARDARIRDRINGLLERIASAENHLGQMELVHGNA